MTPAKRVVMAAAIAIVIVGAELLVVLSPSLPAPVLLRVALANMHLIPFAIALRLPGASVSGPSLVVVAVLGFIQWFVVAWLILLPFGRRRRVGE